MILFVVFLLFCFLFFFFYIALTQLLRCLSSLVQVAQIGGIQGQILTHQGGTYLVQSGTMDGEGHPLTHTTRASPATVSTKWV